jgi:predicted nucleotidyltransferase
VSERSATVSIVADESVIAEATRRLSEAAPGARVILFGSHARGEARPGSDLDLLVIQPEMESRTAEYVRLRNALGELGVPIDLILYRSAEAQKWGGVPGTFIRDALREGRVLLEG